MNKLANILRAHINEEERTLLAKKNGRDPAESGNSLERLLGAKNSPGGQDTVLARISPEDAILLKKRGGSGDIDPDTHRIHFGDENGDAGDGTAGSTSTGSDGNGFGSTDGGNTSFGSSGFDTEDAAYAASVQNALDNPAAEGFGTDEGLGTSESTTPGQGLGTWDFSWNLSPEDQATHNANVNQSISSALGYDIGQNFGGPGGMADMLGLNEQAKAEAARAAAEHEAAKAGTLTRGEEDYVGPGTRGTTTPAAISEYNSLGARGALTGNPWGFVDTEGQSHTNWGSIGADVANVVNNPITAGIATAAGIGPAYGLVSAGINAARGNYGPAIGTLGNMLGPGYGVGLSALNSMINGTPGNFLGGLATNALNSYAPGMGNLAQASGLTGYASRGINEAFQNSISGPGLTGTNADGTMMALSSEGLGSPDSGGYSTMSADAGGDAGGGGVFSGGAGGFTGFGGGGDGGFSGYDFVGSKKKSRYAQPGYLAAMLGDENAV